MKKYPIISHELIEKRLQFVITISVFFLTLMYAVSKVSGETEEKSQALVLTGSIMSIGYLTNYVLFEMSGYLLNTKAIKWISNLLLAGIGTFIIPMFYLAILAAKNGFIPMSQWLVTLNMVVFSTSIIAMILVPAIIFCFIVVGSISTDFNKST